VVEDESVVKYAHFQIREIQVSLAVFGQFFPVPHGIVRDVADCSTDKSELIV
jgi:hypothetical protein